MTDESRLLQNSKSIDRHCNDSPTSFAIRLKKETRERERTAFARNNRDTQLEKADWRVIPSRDRMELSGYCWSLAVVITVYRWFYLICTLCSLFFSSSFFLFRRSKWHRAIFRLRRLTTRTSFARRQEFEMVIFRVLKPIIFTGSKEKKYQYISHTHLHTYTHIFPLFF